MRYPQIEKEINEVVKNIKANHSFKQIKTFLLDIFRLF